MQNCVSFCIFKLKTICVYTESKSQPKTNPNQIKHVFDNFEQTKKIRNFNELQKTITKTIQNSPVTKKKHLKQFKASLHMQVAPTSHVMACMLQKNKKKRPKTDTARNMQYNCIKSHKPHAK